jgi:hypothetical protein
LRRITRKRDGQAGLIIASVLCCVQRGRTALILAAMRSHGEAMQLLMAEGADVYARDQVSECMECAACWRGISSVDAQR